MNLHMKSVRASGWAGKPFPCGFLQGWGRALGATLLVLVPSVALFILILVAALLVAVRPADAVVGAATGSPGPPSPAGAPYIRHIVFGGMPIFSQSDRERFPWLPLSWVDAFHIDTREGTLREELLVAEGDRAEPRLLEESERKLRATGIVTEVRLETQHVAPDSVDLYVHTREVWTTTVDLRFESFEGTRLLSFRLAEKNLLGTGREFSVARNEDLDRTTWAVSLRDRHAFDHRWDIGFDLRDASDGGSFAWHLDRPFFSLDSRWGWVTSYVHGGASPRYYVGGPYYVRPHGDLSHAMLELQRRVGHWGEGVVRVGAGMRIQDQRFNPQRDAVLYDAAGPTPFVVDLGGNYPENRRVRGPIATLSRVPMSYQHRRFLDQMGRQEDIATGHDLSVSAGWVTKALGSSFSGLWFQGADHWNIASTRTIVRLDAGAQGHLGEAKNPNIKAFLQARLNWNWLPSLSIAGSLLGKTGSNIDRHRVYTLGLDTGLRSARVREYPGDRLLRANLELRWVYRKGLVDLLTPGITVFADFGSTWFEDETDFQFSDVRGAIGVGLRLGLNRSATNAPVRIDLGWPVLYSTHRSAPVVSIGTGHVF